MMGVYINMEMPSSCFDCPLGISVNFGVLCCPTHTIISDDNLFDADGRELRRQDWCSLAELPPHGRLIDADALIEKVIAKYLEHEREGELVFAAVEVKQDIIDLISDAPTIIEEER